MKLQNRDIQIINYLKDNQGGTIEQIQKLFFTSYDMARKRLRILETNKFIKSHLHEILNKKVYYIDKIPSYHTLVINSILIKLKNQVVEIKKEATIKNHKVDALLVLKTAKVLIIEVDIFNRTSDEKIINVRREIKNSTGKDALFIIISRSKRREKKKGIAINIVLDEINEIIRYIWYIAIYIMAYK